MDTKTLIDGLVRQTTVLIANVATSAGLRAPLAHVANQIFWDLTGELERQGVGQKVIADMFGLALRSYQQKLRRLSECATDGGQTLWQAVFVYLADQSAVRRAEVLRRFARDDEASVKSILKDLVDSGLIYRTGRGDGTVYRPTPAEDLQTGATTDAEGRVSGGQSVASTDAGCPGPPLGRSDGPQQQSLPSQHPRARHVLRGAILNPRRTLRRIAAPTLSH